MRPLDSRPADEPYSLQRGLEAVVRSLKGHDVSTVRNVFDRWADAVGPAVAAHARPVKLDEHVLVVEVDDPTWATQLRYLQQDILAKVQDLGSGPIERIELRVAAGARATRASNRDVGGRAGRSHRSS